MADRSTWNSYFSDDLPSADLLDPCNPNSQKLGVPADRKDTVPVSVRVDPQDAAMLRSVIEHRVDPRFENTTEFVRHHLAAAVRETLRRGADDEYSRMYEANIAKRLLTEQEREFKAEIEFIEQLEKTGDLYTNDPSYFDQMKPQLIRYHNNMRSPQLKRRLLKVFPELLLDIE